MTGRINSANEAVVAIDVEGAEGQVVRLEGALDTGYNGFLTLPKPVIDELGLAFLGPAHAALGDGNEVEMDLFLAVVQWEGGPRNVLVLESEGGTLVGMAMLAGCRVILDVEEGGAVSIVLLEQIRSVN